MQRSTCLLLSLGAGILLLSGCQSSPTHYAWGNYEDALFAQFHEPAVRDRVIHDYLIFVERHNTETKPVGPGMYAEAGTFMLEKGDIQKALRFYQLEADMWPESRPMMFTLIRNLGGVQ